MRLRVEEVRGLAAAEVRFRTDGVTVIEAPNETGKTTLFDALDALLTFKASSNHREVKALQPAGRDIGSLVEAELTCGDVHLTVRKRFNRDRRSELEIHAPTPRTLTGDEAHDELTRVLEADSDLPLFEALRFRQGRSLDSLVLGGSSTLAGRLDELAGGAGDGADDVLLVKVRAEFERYFTPGGKDGEVLRRADAAVVQACERVERLEHQAADLASAAALLDDRERERARLTERLADLAPALIGHRAARARIHDLKERRRTLEVEAKLADAARQRAQEDVDRRAQLVATVSRLEAGLEGSRPEVEREQERLRVQENRVAVLAAAGREAVAHEQAARARTAAARGVVDLRRRRDELAQLAARQQCIDAALDAAREAEAALEAHPIDDDQLVRIRAADERLRLARARLGDAAPVLVLHARQAIELEIDGEMTALTAGTTRELPVPEQAAVHIPEVLDVTVRAGTSMADRQADVEAARRDLDVACAAVGVPDRAGAEAAAECRREHGRTLVERDATIARELQGGTRDELADRLRTRATQFSELEAKLAAAATVDAQTGTGAGSDAGAGPAAVDQAAQLTLDTPADDLDDRLAALEVAEAQARDAAELARRDHTDLVAQVERLRRDVQRLVDDTSARQKELHDHVAALAADRERISDVGLDDLLVDARTNVTLATDAVTAATDELDRLRADEVELLAANAEQAVTRAEEQLREVREGALVLRERIQIAGGEGIGEALQTAVAEQERLRSEQRSVRRRAAAAATLKDAIERARDAAYAAYREPLRERIGGAGRLVFGDSFDVALDDDLTVTMRHLDGSWLEWDQLSAGAREQLAILTALAAADLTRAGGVPLVLDDTLGYTDLDRLERLCAVLGRVDGPQVVVLTCVGDRFQGIGSAEVVRLREVTAP